MDWDGTSGVHVHMTNTRITDAEIFERRYPVLLREYSIRKGSGGNGRRKGGDGVIRDIEFRVPMTVGILSERRVYRPYGMAGGEDGECGLNLWMRKVKGEDGELVWKEVNLGAKNSAEMKIGERIVVCTPGGGGYGSVGSNEEEELEAGAVVRRAGSDPTVGWKGGSLKGRAEMQETN